MTGIAHVLSRNCNLTGKVSELYRPLPKSLFAWSKPFLINLRLAPGDVKTHPSGFKQLTSLTLRFAKIYYQKRFNDRSKGFPFGQQPVNMPQRGVINL
jgi:hypothetical protein